MESQKQKSKPDPGHPQYILDIGSIGSLGPLSCAALEGVLAKAGPGAGSTVRVPRWHPPFRRGLLHAPCRSRPPLTRPCLRDGPRDWRGPTPADAQPWAGGHDHAGTNLSLGVQGHSGRGRRLTTVTLITTSTPITILLLLLLLILYTYYESSLGMQLISTKLIRAKYSAKLSVTRYPCCY